MQLKRNNVQASQGNLYIFYYALFFKTPDQPPRRPLGPAHRSPSLANYVQEIVPVPMQEEINQMNGDFGTWSDFVTVANSEEMSSASTSEPSFDSSFDVEGGDTQFKTLAAIRSFANEIELNTANLDNGSEDDTLFGRGVWRNDEHSELNVFDRNISNFSALDDDEPDIQASLFPQPPPPPPAQINSVRTTTAPVRPLGKDDDAQGEMIRFTNSRSEVGKWIWTPIRNRLSLGVWQDTVRHSEFDLIFLIFNNKFSRFQKRSWTHSSY